MAFAGAAIRRGRGWLIAAVLLLGALGGCGAAADDDRPAVRTATNVTTWGDIFLPGPDGFLTGGFALYADNERITTTSDGAWFTVEAGHDLPFIFGPAAGFLRGQGETCLARDRSLCFRIVPGELAIEQSGDGGQTWVTAWRVDGAAYERLAVSIENTARAARQRELDVRRHLACSAVAAAQVAGETVVIAACGVAGFVRGGRDGQWQLLGFPPGRAAYLFNPAPLPLVTGAVAGWVIVLMFFVLVAGAEFHARRHVAPADRYLVAGVPLVFLVLALIADALDPTLGLVAWAAAAVAGVGAMLMWFLRYIALRPVEGTWPAVAGGVGLIDLALLSLATQGLVPRPLAWSGVVAVTAAGAGLASWLGSRTPWPEDDDIHERVGLEAVSDAANH